MTGRRATLLARMAALATLILVAACAPPREGGDPLFGSVPDLPRADTQQPRFTDLAFIAEDGALLPLRSWLPEGWPRAIILGLHGFNDYGFAFDTPGRSWAKDGIATFAYDQRGFGLAPGRGLWAGREILARDAATASHILRRRYPGTPIYLMGESMGGAIAIVAAAGESVTPRPDIDGLILSAPAIWGRTTMGLIPRLALWGSVRLVPELTLSGRGLRIRPSDNVEMLRRLSRDPSVIKETRVSTIYHLVDLMDAALAAGPLLRGRMLLLYGAHDEIVPEDGMRAFVATLPPDPKRRLALYGKGFHMLTRDLDGAVVQADVAHWVLNPASPLPSGADTPPATAFFSQPD